LPATKSAVQTLMNSEKAPLSSNYDYGSHTTDEMHHDNFNTPMSYNDDDKSFFARRKNYIAFGIILLFVIAIGVFFLVYFVVVDSADDDDHNSSTGDTGLSNALSRVVTVPNIMKHLERFQTIAEESNNNSRSVLNGYNNSAAYVIETLQSQTDYTITKQYFETPVYTQLDSPKLALQTPFFLSFKESNDFQGMRYGGNGLFNWPSAYYTIVEGVGCTDEQWSGFVQLKQNLTDQFGQGQFQLIAIAARGSECNLYDTALKATQFEADGLLLSSSSLSNSRVRATEWTVQSTIIQIPTLSITETVRNLLIGQLEQQHPARPTLSLYVHNEVVVATTFNVIAESKHGDPTKIVMSGSHLDSVAAGPGLNDDASGSSVNLEMAIQFYKHSLGKDAPNKAIFSWWGSEELGLIGSRHFVRMLSSQEKENIQCYINMDMLASPNYVLGVLNGTLTPFENVQAPSLVISEMFGHFYDENKIPWSSSSMGGGSDFYPFQQGGIPASGLAAGAGGIKSEAERTKFGGFANAPLDPCYHQPCDTIENINQKCLSETSSAAAYVFNALIQTNNIHQFLWGQTIE